LRGPQWAGKARASVVPSPPTARDSAHQRIGGHAAEAGTAIELPHDPVQLEHIKEIRPRQRGFDDEKERVPALEILQHHSAVAALGIQHGERDLEPPGERVGQHDSLEVPTGGDAEFAGADKNPAEFRKGFGRTGRTQIDRHGNEFHIFCPGIFEKRNQAGGRRHRSVAGGASCAEKFPAGGVPEHFGKPVGRTGAGGDEDFRAAGAEPADGIHGAPEVVFSKHDQRGAFGNFFHGGGNGASGAGGVGVDEGWVVSAPTGVEDRKFQRPPPFGAVRSRSRSFEYLRKT